MAQIRFAQISDIHISHRGDLHDMLSGRSAGFLARVIDELNRMADLDFVLFTGDLMVEGAHSELEQFLQAVQTLQKPYYVIPGNHDRREPDDPHGLTRRQFAERFNPQLDSRPPDEYGQVGYWSQEVKPGVQLIGLDSNLDDDWGGIISPAQMAWLEAELSTHAGRLVILAVHHPLHRLSPIDDLPGWNRFVCQNGSDVLALLDRHPQVKLVLHGHHHLTRTDRLNGRVHLACPALAIFPCAYRLVQVDPQTGGTYRIAWQTCPAADEATTAEARRRMFDRWAAGTDLPLTLIEQMVEQAAGRAEDRHGQMVV
ncbi:MAG: hypothetical protein D6784_13155 [Chloroflexi bacterium]|nr:MAG: hypothetical protein D6784_13155 [Chloroflexota bacterium]